MTMNSSKHDRIERELWTQDGGDVRGPGGVKMSMKEFLRAHPEAQAYVRWRPAPDHDTDYDGLPA